MKTKINKNYGREIPEQIKDNISPSEEILHQTKWRYTQKLDKISSYTIIGMTIFTLIFSLYLFSRSSDVLAEFWSIYLFAMPITFITMLIILRKLELGKEFFLVISNKKLYLYTKVGREDLIDITELTSIKAIIFRKKRISWKISKEIGKIVIISDDLKGYHKNRIVIQNVQNVNYIYQKLESILWYYSNSKERINLLRNKHDIELPFTFNIEQKIYERFTRYRRTFDILIIICLSSIIFGIIFIFLKFPFLINLFLLMFGGGFIGMFLVYRYKVGNILTPVNNNLILEENKISLSRQDFLETIHFNENILLDFLHIQDLKKSPIGSFETVGAIIIKEALDSSKIIKFGPIFELYKFFEVIYLQILNWKGEQGLLLPKEHFQDLMQKKIKELPQVLAQEQEKPILKEIYVENNILKQLQNYLERDEQILLTYKPIVNIKKQIIIISIGILSIILLYLSISLTYYFLSITFFVISIFILIFPIIFGILALCSIPTMLIERKSLYIFTEQKLIIKYPKQFIIIKLNNINSINRINKRNKYHLVISLKKELESSLFIDKSNIIIQNISKDNNLIDKVKYIRLKVEN